MTDFRKLAQIITNLDARLRAVENREPRSIATTVHTPTLPWADAGPPYVPVGYWKDQAGTLSLQGRVIGGTFPSTIMTLPVGARPSGTITFGLDNNNVVQVLANGEVRAVSGNGGPINLDVVYYRVEQ